MRDARLPIPFPISPYLSGKAKRSLFQLLPPYARRCVAFGPDGERIATGSRDGTVRMFDPSNGRCTAKLKGQIGDVWSLSYSPGEGRAVRCSDQGPAMRPGNPIRCHLQMCRWHTYRIESEIRGPMLRPP